MKNQQMLNRIESIIDTLREVQLSNDTAITELEGIKEEILSQEKGEQRDTTTSASAPNAIPPKQDTNPDTKVKDTGRTHITHHTN